MKILFDSSSLILLIEKLNLREPLQKCVDRSIELIIPETVWSEFTEKNKDEVDLSFIESNFKIAKTQICEELDRLLDSDSGEIAVASLSKEFQNNGIEYFCIIDEKYGSKVCRLEGLRVKGSIGFLLYLKENDLISGAELIEIKKKIQKSDFRIKREYLDKLC